MPLAKQNSTGSTPFHAGWVALAQIADKRISGFRMHRYDTEGATVHAVSTTDAVLLGELYRTRFLILMQRMGGTGRDAARMGAEPANVGYVNSFGINFRDLDARLVCTEVALMLHHTGHFAGATSRAERFLRKKPVQCYLLNDLGSQYGLWVIVSHLIGVNV